jgi:hypothetical protein
MNERNKPRNRENRITSSENTATQIGGKPEITADEQVAMRQLLEEARQSVRRLIKKEAAAELVTEDVLSFRLSRP